MLRYIVLTSLLFITFFLFLIDTSILTSATSRFHFSPSSALTANIWQYPVSPYTPGSYASRTFFCCADDPLGRHLGEDEALAEGTPIRAIGQGIIKVYDSATGYGELVVVIEHDLGKSYNFQNGYGNAVSTRYILSIYGHLRASQLRGGQATGLSENQRVEAGTIIGYVNDDAHNGDGAEHLHMGIRLSDAVTAQSRDASWFRGYERTTDFGKDYAAASAVLSTLISECCNTPAPVLITEENSEQAVALDGVTMVRDPLPVITAHNFSADQHTRVMLFIVNADLRPGENLSIITAQAEDSQHRFYPLTVEYIQKVPNFDWLTQVDVRLPDEIRNVGDVWISINLRGLTSNKVLLRIKPS